jgi:hypothetical protein
MKKSLGQIAYEGYFDYFKGKYLVSGEDLPTWDNQSIVIKEAWEAAGYAVLVEDVMPEV